MGVLEEKLISAVCDKDVAKVKYLLEQGVDFRHAEERALRLAANEGHADIVQALIEAGADVSANNDGALYQAAKSNHTEIVRLLLAHGADAKARHNEIFIDTVKYNRAETVRLLLKHGADMVSEDYKALRCAAFFASRDAFIVLVEHLFQPAIWHSKEPESVHEEALKVIAALKYQLTLTGELSADKTTFVAIEAPAIVEQSAFAAFHAARRQQAEQQPIKNLPPRPPRPL